MLTGDGSHSVRIPEMAVTYHSTHGAIQESLHVFIGAGLQHFLSRSVKKDIAIFEMGFGTGLNALLTLQAAALLPVGISYTAIDAFPLPADLFRPLNYSSLSGYEGLQTQFMDLHTSEWNTEVIIGNGFRLTKLETSLENYQPQQKFDIIYFDAFAPDIQPELWTAAGFKKLFALLEDGGVLTTYCSKSIVRKALAEAGFRVEKIPGPPHKREMVRAFKDA